MSRPDQTLEAYCPLQGQQRARSVNRRWQSSRHKPGMTPHSGSRREGGPASTAISAGSTRRSGGCRWDEGAEAQRHEWLLTWGRQVGEDVVREGGRFVEYIV